MRLLPAVVRITDVAAAEAEPVLALLRCFLALAV